MTAATGGNGAVVRDATDDDLDAIQAIYAHYVLRELSSFEEVAPDTAEMARRRTQVVRRRLPYIVAEVDRAVRGFAYAAPYRMRSAYRYMIEDSIYVGPDALGHGLGRLLLHELIERCTALGYRQMVAVIGDSGNTASINLHGKCGFRPAGVLTSAGFKLGRWTDSVIMQRPLGESDTSLPPA
jgi:L-amino acid N-acyltransferase YncA